MKKSTKIIIAAAMILGVSGAAFSYGKHNHWGVSAEDKAEFVSERVTRKLELNEFQQQNLKVLVDDMLDLMKDIRADKEAHMKQVEALLVDPVFDQGKALQMIQSKTQQINDRAPAAIASLATFLDSLDMAQKDKVQSFIAKGMHHRHSKHGND